MGIRVETKNAHRLLSRSKEIVESFFEAYDARGDDGKSPQRAPTDLEQDILRAALVFAAAGLDSAVKHLIRGSLPKLASQDSEVSKELEKYIQRKIRGSEKTDTASTTAFLAKILAAKDTQKKAIEEYIRDLTGESLQSAAQLIKATKALGVNPEAINISELVLQPIFDVRNDIIHELDIKIRKTRGRSNTRRRDIMYEYSSGLIAAGERLVMDVETKLSKIA